ncbi:MAG: hypothetical protein D5R97_05615 [Candidatus Syntrophonatronum acetioxidans]|uniref:DUF5320 domain-containing protein n=1 Tax=Candidatus Syntrophonatronum acetioxidans TaxID=1795816 RepID=A0A424YE60_9FIRM|nr:MAG: hypothetical protein D5R97_05615 [Candidatus Syntrophonatronum acetioxidans]
MPGFDRRGPLGYGPRTGRGLGDCGDPAWDAPRRGFWGGRRRGPFSPGRGPGRGGGLRLRRRFFPRFFRPGPAPWAYGYEPSPYEYYEEESPQVEKEEELEFLKEEAKLLEKEMESIKKRINELESSPEEEEQ